MSNYREQYANDVNDLDLLAMGKPMIREQVAELIVEQASDDDPGDVTDDMWADAINTVADGIYSEVFGHLDDKGFHAAKLSEIVTWLDDGEPFTGATLAGLADNWREYDADDVAANA